MPGLEVPLLGCPQGWRANEDILPFTMLAIDRWVKNVVKLKLHNQRDPQDMTIDEIARAIRWRYPFTGGLELIRRSKKGATFRGGKYVYKVPFRAEAKDFCPYEAKIVNVLPIDADVEFLRQKFSGTFIPILRSPIIPGTPLRSIVKSKLPLPYGLPRTIGKAIALMHSCQFTGELRDILDRQRLKWKDKVCREIDRQVRLGISTCDSRETLLSLNKLSPNNFVFSHGDLQVGNIIVKAPQGERVGIIDFGESCYNVREFDFGVLASTSKFLGREFLLGVVDSYQMKTAQKLETNLIEKFGALRDVLKRGPKSRRREHY